MSNSTMDRLAPMPPIMNAMLEISLEPEFQLRCAISFVVAVALYMSWGSVINGWYGRKVSGSVTMDESLSPCNIRSSS